MDKKAAVIFDLDGTLSNTDHRQHFVKGTYGKKDFDKFYQGLEQDPPHSWCVRLVRMYRTDGLSIIFCSGRPEDYRGPTQDWIQKHCELSPDQYRLLMRPSGNYQCDTIIKRQMFEASIYPEFKVEVAIDDRARVVKMWREISDELPKEERFPCLQCAVGDF